MPEQGKSVASWLNRHPILDEGHARDLDQAAAINEFHHRMPRDQAEALAHEEYRKTHHASAAAFHLAGIRAAQGCGSMDEAKQHGALYASHMRALGEDPYGPVPEHIRLQAEDSKHTKVYRFTNHGADSFLGQSLGKSEKSGSEEAQQHFAPVRGGTVAPCGSKSKRRVYDPAKVTCSGCNRYLGALSRDIEPQRKSEPRLQRLLKAAKVVLDLAAAHDLRKAIAPADENGFSTTDYSHMLPEQHRKHFKLQVSTGPYTYKEHPEHGHLQHHEAYLSPAAESNIVASHSAIVNPHNQQGVQVPFKTVHGSWKYRLPAHQLPLDSAAKKDPTLRAAVESALHEHLHQHGLDLRALPAGGFPSSVHPAPAALTQKPA